MTTTDTNSPTPPQGEIEQQYNFANELQFSLMYEYMAPHNQHKSIRGEVDRLMRIHRALITAQVQAAEARARRELIWIIDADDVDAAYVVRVDRLRNALHEALAALKEPSHE